MPNYQILIIWLLSVLPSNSLTLKYLDASKLELIKYAYAQASNESVNPDKYINLLECESQFNISAVGDHGKAFGIAQFWEETFNTFSKQYGIKGSYRDPKAQIDLSTKMIADGLWSHWTRCNTKNGMNKIDFNKVK